MYVRRRSGRVVLTYFLIMNRSMRSSEKCSSNWSDWRAGSILSEETATRTLLLLFLLSKLFTLFVTFS